ncbi:2-amino-4-hydroxy-6-hydroxymethyldihydropteridine diphosphokinase [Flavihumibacter sp. R14]|nr:2-amino-4-hydroxy-6-hydroxymethyldihydropteridine diphosphokinase [Flavihumibacter soli]
MEEAYLLLGSNLGDSKKYISDAVHCIKEQIGKLTGLSSLYQTASWGKTDQPDFINQVVRVETNLNPEKLLHGILVIETKLGRERSEKWGSRKIDIDLLFYGDQVIKSENLVVPHPFLHQRRFTLMPLVELNPGLVHPVFKKTVEELNCELDDNLAVTKL